MASVAPGDPESHLRVTLPTGSSAGLKKLSYYFIIQEVITHVTDMLSCQGLTDIILSLRFLTLPVTSAFSSRKQKQGVLSH